MKVDVNLASKDPLKFIDSVLKHHKEDNQDLRCAPVRETSHSDDDEEDEEWNFKLNKTEVWTSKNYYKNVNTIPNKF